MLSEAADLGTRAPQTRPDPVPPCGGEALGTRAPQTKAGSEPARPRADFVPTSEAGEGGERAPQPKRRAKGGNGESQRATATGPGWQATLPTRTR